MFIEGGLGACSVTSSRRLNTVLGPTDLYSVLPICRDFANAVPSPCRASASCLETPGQQLPCFRFEPSQTHSSLMTRCTDPCASRSECEGRVCRSRFSPLAVSAMSRISPGILSSLTADSATAFAHVYPPAASTPHGP